MVRLKELRQQNGYTQKELSKLVNYSQNLISTWESGSHESNNKALISLANIFNVSVDYLIGDENNIPKEINNSLYIKLTKHLSPNQQSYIKDNVNLDEPQALQAKVYIKGLKKASGYYKKSYKLKLINTTNE